MEIKVLGPGCLKCQQTEKNVKEAVQESVVDATIDKVTDLMEIARYGVLGTPTVVDKRPGPGLERWCGLGEIMTWIKKQTKGERG